MKTVSQKDPLGCSVACVASVAGLDYNKTRNLFKNPRYAKKKGYYCKEIVEALKRLDLDYAYNYLKPNKKSFLKTRKCIVFIKRSKKYPAGHFLARGLENLWMDPWINFPKEPIKSGWRRKLPGKAIYVIYPISDEI